MQHDLKTFLEAMERDCDRVERRQNDPVEIVWEYEDRADREIVAFIAATMAYGQVAVLKTAVRRVLALLGPAPATFLVEGDLEALEEPLENFVYRMTRGPDVFDLLMGIRAVLRQYGSLEACYLGADGEHLERLSHLVRSVRSGRARPKMSRGLRYLLTDPADGSTAKRMHLFLRWMVRGPDPIDPGTWESVDPAVLRMPLDTHTSRICRYLGMTERKSNDAKTVEEVTDALRKLDPKDPLRFDFAICHLGMSKQCIHRFSPDHCPSCPIQPVCTVAAAGA